MGEKDISQKVLEAYNDVFADIVNVLLFQGQRVIQPDELKDRLPRTSYKADEKIRELERDVIKEWVRNHIRIACIGLENQTRPDRYMSLRALGYDGLEYRMQLRDLQPGERPAPVITLVLYFGYEKHWDQPLSLIEALDVPEMFWPYVTDAKVNLFEIAWLSREQVNLFQSDFRVVADYFVQMRENRNYDPSREQLDHIQAVLQLLNVMDQEHRFEMKQNETDPKETEAKSMSEWLSRVINDSEARGESRGEARGRKTGETKGLNITNWLWSQGRGEEAMRAEKDEQLFDKLRQEYAAATANTTAPVQ